MDVVDQFEAELDAIQAGWKLILMLEANDTVERIIRVDDGQNRASFIAGWGPGDNGNGFEPGPGEHGVPGPDAAIESARESGWGEGVSTVVETGHEFWLDSEHDATIDAVAEVLG